MNAGLGEFPGDCRKYDLLSIPVMDEILTLLARHYYYNQGMYALLVNSRRWGSICNMLVREDQIIVTKYSVRDWKLNDAHWDRWDLMPMALDLANPDCFWLAAVRINYLRSTTVGGRATTVRKPQ